MASAAVTNFALNFDENVQWAMVLRLKPDVLAAIRDAGPDASHIRFATEGGKHVIEVRDKKFVLDCREEKTGATICEAHRDWGRGEITEVGVAKLRGDVQTTFAEKQMLANSKQNQSGADLHDRIIDASCVRIPPEKKIPSSAGTHNRNTVIMPMKTLLPAGSTLRSPPVQATQERQPDSRGTSPARGRQTPPKLTEANGQEVPKATLEEVARMAASHGKLRFCVMALLSARNFRVRRKLGQDVITLCKEGRHDKVPSESTLEMTIKKVSQMSSWGIVLTDQARTELVETVLPQFRTGSWAAVSSPVGSPADGTIAKSSAATAVRTGGSKLNPQHAAAAAVALQQKVAEGKDLKKVEDDGGKRKAPDSDSTHKRKKHKGSSKKDGHRDREHDSSKHKERENDRGKERAKGEQKVVSKSMTFSAGADGASGGRRAHKDETREEKKVRKERRDEKKAGKRDRDRGRGSDGKKEKRAEHGDRGDKREGERKGDKKRKVDKDAEAATAVGTSKHARYSEERKEKGRQSGKPPSAERDRVPKDAGPKSRQASTAAAAAPAAQRTGGAEGGPGPSAHSMRDGAAKSNTAHESVRAHPSSDEAARAVGKKSRSRSASPPADKSKRSRGQQDQGETAAASDVPAKLSSPIPPKVVPPKVAVELLEGDGKAMPAWLEAADEGALEDDADGNAVDHSEQGAHPGEDASREAGDMKDAADAHHSEAEAAQLQQQRQQEGNKARVSPQKEEDDDDDDFLVGGDAAPPPRAAPSAGREAVRVGAQQGGRQGGHIVIDYTPEEDSKPPEEHHEDTREGRSGTPDGASDLEEEEEEHEDDTIDRTGVHLPGGGTTAPVVERSNGGTGARDVDGVQLNSEELAQYVERVSQGNGQLCLDKKQLEQDYKVYLWLVREVKEQKAVLQCVSQSAATGAEVVSQHAEALREFDATQVAWFQKSKLMSLLYHRLLVARNAVAAVKAQQQRRLGLLG